MTKVYLLLRNNKQTGPHSLEELLKLGLKPLDLIWVEGKSYGWSYPSEINSLKPYVTPVAEQDVSSIPEKKSDTSPAQQNANKAYMPAESPASNSPEIVQTRKVYVSMPTNVIRREEPPKKQIVEIATPETGDKLDTAKIIEEKAEALRKKIQSYVPENKSAATKSAEPMVTKYAATLPEREEEYTSWIYNQKASKIKNVNEAQKKLAAGIVATLLILAIGYGVSQYSSNNKKEVVLTASTETQDAGKVIPEPLITESAEPAAPSTQPLTENNIAANTDKVPVEKVVRNTSPANKPVVETHKTTPVAADTRKKIVLSKAPEKEVAVKAPPETKPVEVKPAVKKEAESAEASPKKKKSFNEKVDAFFSKLTHKKEVTPVTETAASTSTTNNTNVSPGTVERKATHRDDKAVAATPVVAPQVTSPRVENKNLADFVEVTSTKPSENWMLGVHGLKVSLHNTGNEVVKTAEVELRYYTEQNEVLDKKIVNFNNIPPGKTITLPAPDHRLADHADVRLVNAK